MPFTNNLMAGKQCRSEQIQILNENQPSCCKNSVVCLLAYAQTLVAVMVSGRSPRAGMVMAACKQMQRVVGLS